MKKNIILVCAFIILIAIFLVTNRTEKYSERAHIPDDIVAIDSAKVSQIELKRSEDEEAVVLEKRGIDWHVSSPVDYRANQQYVGNLLDRAGGMKIVARISSNPEKQSQFKVDSTGTLVKIFESNVMKADFIIGKSGGSVGTYIRQAGSDEIYSVDGYLSSTFSKRFQDWRDKTITEFEKEQLKSLKLVSAGEELTISRKSGSFDEWDLTRSDDSEIYYGKKERIEQVINSLWRFQTQDFRDNPDSSAVAKFAAPDSTVIITLADNMGWTLYFEPDNEKANRFLVKRDDKGDLIYFVTNKGIINNIFATFEDLKGEPPPPPEPVWPDSTGGEPEIDEETSLFETTE